MGTFCGHPLDHGISLVNDNVTDNYYTFDNLPASMLTILTIITLEGWTGMMYNFSDGDQAAMA